MRATKLATAIGASALLFCALASAAGAQEKASRRAPIIRVYSGNGSYALETAKYVEPIIEVSENAYVFAVSMDVDGQIQVLQPDFPGISVKIAAHRALSLPKFFAGFGRNDGTGYYSAAGYDVYNGYTRDGYLDARGTVIALASRAPFNLERIESGGDWNISAIRQLIEGRSPEMAAQSLASYLGAEGEAIGRDFMRFAGRQRSGYSGYALDSYYGCDPFSAFAFSPTLALSRSLGFSRMRLLRSRGQQVRILGYDLCGFPIFAVRQSSFAGGFPGVRPPRPRGDTATGVFPKSRLPRGTPRPTPAEQSAQRVAPRGVFPMPQREGLPQMGDVTITAPKGRRSEPGQILQGYRPTGGTMAPPQGRIPIERVSAPRSTPEAATGVQPVRESRPEPRSSAPPPSRVPDATPRQAPPPPTPVVNSRPSSPPPPPRSEPARTPSKQQ